MEHNELTLAQHIEELRKRLIIITAFFVVSVIIGLFVAKPLIHFLQYSDHAKALQLHAFNVTDPLKIYFQVDFVVALVLTMPVIMYQLWAFVRPGLYVYEQKATLRYIPYVVVLFIVGVLFSYNILFPYIMKFMMQWSKEMDVTQTIGIYEYFQFLFKITVPFGFVFQLPVIMHFVARIGLVTPMWMAKVRKYAYFCLLVIAAIIAPPEVVSHLMITIPLCLLYEISIWIARLGYRKYVRSERKRLQALGMDEQTIQQMLS
ncbi:twin-arginine translocase subunit TatC [Kurthia massiliensis]|uniref:twin-arginine translocase subunit TatC n=1 Tax=Kurthia massiliensis TaxID=1033739 RepID=UPI00028925F3|nr:twin-arginine translocase subunit TatC [Kurthia massiliensis]